MNIFHKVKTVSLAFIALCLSSCSVLLPDGFAPSATTVPPAPKFEEVHGKCVEVIDGDTFTLSTADNKKYTVNLWGVDAPELNQNYGYKSKQGLSDSILDENVSVTVMTKGKDAQISGKVYHSFFSSFPSYSYRSYVNRHLVSNGYAWHNDADPSQHDLEIANAQKDAQKRKCGLWGRFPNPTPPWEWRKGYSFDGKKLVKRTSSGKYWVSAQNMAYGFGKEQTIHNYKCDYYGITHNYDYDTICGVTETSIKYIPGFFTDSIQGKDCHLCRGASEERAKLRQHSREQSSTSSTVTSTTSLPSSSITSSSSRFSSSASLSSSGTYWINSNSGETHNSRCRWYGNTKEGYYSESGSGNNCGICGGAGYRASSYSPSTYTPSSYAPSYPSYSSDRVYGRGYYRKDGTYVRPHTRRRPSR